ncbi:MAG: TIGR04283 family arsenosugar biosynthesis glycosyltransferase [Beijerinckiaceae bacterium]|nr:TIGR04283 family arsenosugar biosynthesis glycosyltransferase [Beijerinckiaceae bacterium]
MDTRELSLSIVIPVLNEAAGVEERLRALAPLRRLGVEVVVVDGGSVDSTVPLAQGKCHCLLVAPRGRADQMNAGAAAARGDVLLFLHADTRLPDGALDDILQGLCASERVWGRFDVVIEGRSRLLPLIAAMMNLRSRLTGVATGDQAMFVRKTAFDQAGGFPAIALMEDIALSRALKRLSKPVCLRAKVRTAGRRWDERGALRTIFLMWRLRLAYFLGADPARLAARYGYRPAPQKSQAS